MQIQELLYRVKVKVSTSVAGGPEFKSRFIHTRIFDVSAATLQYAWRYEVNIGTG